MVDLPKWAKSKGNAKFFPRGGYHELEARVSRLADPETPIVFYYAFNQDTRAGPFVGPDETMPNCGIRAAGGAIYKAGFKNTRIVFSPWNRNFDFRATRLNGVVPEIFGIGSMQIHEADAHDKIEQANALGDKRPLIIGGGPHANYQAWDYFNKDQYKSVDVAVRGEPNVTLALLEAILDHKGKKETMLQGYQNARKAGALDKIPGITYISEDREVLFETGNPLLVGDVDEFPREIIGLSLLEPRHNGKGLHSSPTPPHKLKEQGARIISLQLSEGCNFRCDYCPIPQMKQFTERAKSPERVVLDLKQIIEGTGISSIFGADDNIFTLSEDYIVDLFIAMARAKANGISFRNRLSFGTEATEHQANLLLNHIPLMRDAGLRAIWFGIEDLTEDLVRKGQSPDKTIRVFKEMLKYGIAPMPMMMHFDGQPLNSKNGNLEGILDQVKFLREHGAQTIQVTYNSPSIGSKGYSTHFNSGTVLTKAGDLDVGWFLYDGNHVVSTSRENDPLERQDNVIACYEYFYNWRNLVSSAASYIKSIIPRGAVKDIAETALAMQISGRKGLQLSKINIQKWRESLKTKIFKYAQAVPESPIPIVSVT